MTRTVIFDFDGTLHETGRIYLAAFRQTRARLLRDGYQVPEYPDGEILRWLGVNARDTWARFMPDLPWEKAAGYARFLGDTLNRLLDTPQARLYDGAEEALTALKDRGLTLVLLSNCTAGYRDAALRRFGLERWFSAFFCAQAYGERPKEEIFPAIAATYPGGYCIVGDRASDLRVAQVHGFPFIGCAYGYGDPAELAGAAAVAGRVRDLPGLLAGPPFA